MSMFNYGEDGHPHDDDERFYNQTVYNEDYYIEREQEMIRESNIELELERLENEAIREMREEGLLRPTLDPLLSRNAAGLISDPENEIEISPASFGRLQSKSASVIFVERTSGRFL